CRLDLHILSGVRLFPDGLAHDIKLRNLAEIKHREKHECHDGNVDVYRKKQAEELAKQELRPVNRLAHDRINGLTVQFVINQVNTHEHGDQEPEEINARQAQVLDELLRFRDRQVTDNRRKANDQHRKYQKE